MQQAVDPRKLGRKTNYLHCFLSYGDADESIESLKNTDI